MELTLLTVQPAPARPRSKSGSRAVLAGRASVVVHRREICDEPAAAQAGMRGAPTLLTDGVDPSALPGRAPSLSCRLYRDVAGHLARHRQWRPSGRRSRPPAMTERLPGHRRPGDFAMVAE